MADNRYGRNPSGALDPTRTKAEEVMDKEQKRVSDLVHVLRYVAENAGFDIVGRVVLYDKRSGKTFR